MWCCAQSYVVEIVFPIQLILKCKEQEVVQLLLALHLEVDCETVDRIDYAN